MTTPKEKPALQFALPQTPQKDVSESNRRHLREAAERIERGESLNGLDLELIAAALRAFADRIPDEAKKAKGRQPSKLNPAGLMLEYWRLTNGGKLTGRKAIDTLAERADVSVEAIRKALRSARP